MLHAIERLSIYLNRLQLFTATPFLYGQCDHFV